METHTPTPWWLDDEVPPNPGSVIGRLSDSSCADCRGLGIPIAAAVGPEYWESPEAADLRANARYMMRAVNAHDALLEACRAARSAIAGTDIAGFHPSTLALLERAIAKAEVAGTLPAVLGGKAGAQ